MLWLPKKIADIPNSNYVFKFHGIDFDIVVGRPITPTFCRAFINHPPILSDLQKKIAEREDWAGHTYNMHEDGWTKVVTQ